MTAKRASIIYFYMGDSYLTTLAQETVPLHLAMEGYDRSILLKFDTDAGPFELSEKSEKKAHRVLAPTRENLAVALRELAQDGYEIDLFIFSHGYRMGAITCSTGKHGESAPLRASWLEAEFKDETLPLRLVYSIACWGHNMSPTWAQLGAKASVGTRGVNFYPTRFKGFIKRWAKGEGLAGAVQRSDSKGVRTPVHIYIQADAVGTMAKWHTPDLDDDSRPLSKLTSWLVLWRGAQSEAYFRKMWVGKDWQEGRTGKQNMNWSSHQEVVGKRTLKK